MTAISWKNPVNGDWSDASDWSTGTVPTSADDVTIAVAGAYIVTIGAADHAKSLTFNASQAALLESAGSLTVSGALTVSSGFVSLNEANTIGSVSVAGGVLAFGNGGALGTGSVALTGGELLATENETLTNALSFSGSSTIAAAHGTTLSENASSMTVAANLTLNFGALGEDGIILWHTPASTIFNSPLPTINVQAGTLRGADSSFGFFLAAEAVTVAAGATLDLAGNSTSITNLSGGGVVTDTGMAATLTLAAASFSGAIRGPLSLVVGGPVVLSGAITYSGSTTINSGDSLQLGGVGGPTGSTGGAIVDGMISGAGSLEQAGTGVTSINAANTYSGGTSISAGTLAIGNGSALGTGTLTLTGGALLGTATETFVNPITFPFTSTTTTFAAAHGTTLNLTGNVTFAGNNTVVIGAPGQDGDVVWSGAASGTTAGDTFDLLDGTLTAGGSILQVLLANSTGVTIAAGATLDWAGNFSDINNLQGAGTVTNSGAMQSMPLVGTTNFSGTISGALSIGFLGNVLLSGLEDYTGDAQFGGQFTAANAGTYDIVSNNGIEGNPADFFINSGLFEKTGGGGTSDVTSDFVNNGTITVSSGSLVFSGGFTNNGIIQGVLSESDGVWTVTASTPNAPPAATTADIITRDSNNGNFEIYDLGNNTIQAAYALGLTAITDQVAGLGGFDGTDTSDMMLRSSTGAFEIEDISNNSVTAFVSMGQIGLEWTVSGFADFSGNRGETDMLTQNSSNGDFEVYDISNNQITNAVALGAVGAPWVVAGFGDFSGHAGETGDMLMRNASTGAFEVYDISNNAITFAASMGQIGLEWQVAGFGDFSGNANETDMVMRNSSTGAFEIYDISNNLITSAAAMGQVGLEWSVVGFGPINGAGASDMLVRNTNTGAFEVYDIANNQITSAVPMGQVGLEWSVAGIAADPPASANAQLAQAMASYAPAGSTVVSPSAPDQAATQSIVPNILSPANGQSSSAG